MNMQCTNVECDTECMFSNDSPRVQKENTEVQCTDDVCRSGHMLIQLGLICRFLRVLICYSPANIGVGGQIFQHLYNKSDHWQLLLARMMVDVRVHTMAWECENLKDP